MNTKSSAWRGIVCLLFCCTGLLSAQSVGISHWTFAGGGGLSTNADYRMLSTVAQPAIGKSQNTGNIHHAGFWYPVQRFVTAVDQPVNNIPAVYGLEQNYPNPFNPSTTIRYGLPDQSDVTLTVFNTLGQQVAQLIQGEQEAGYHEVRFECGGLSSGVYFYRLKARDFMETKRMLVLK